MRRLRLPRAAFLVTLVAMTSCLFGAASAAPPQPTTQLEGTLRVLHRDTGMMRVPGENANSYAVDLDASSDEDVRELVWIDGLERDLDLGPNARVRVTGTMGDGGRIVVSGAAAVVAVGSPDGRQNPQVIARGALLRDRTLLVINVDFSHLGGTMPTTNALRDAIFTGHGSVNSTFSQSSYGQTKFVGIQNPLGDITPPIVVNESTPCDSVGYSATQQLAGLGYDYDAYDDAVFIISEASCSWAGLGSMSNKGSWIAGANWNLGNRTVEHELGHNTGLSHAGQMQCMPAPSARVLEEEETALPCVRQEYGAPDSLMGGGADAAGFDGIERARAGWMPAANVQPVTGAGSYRIATTDVATSETQLLQFYRDTGFKGENRYLYVGLRSPHVNANPRDADWHIGGPTNAVTIYLGEGLNARFPTDVLVDTHVNPANAYSSNPRLLVGETFTDPYTGQRIRLDSVDGDGLHANLTLTPQAGWVRDGPVPGHTTCAALNAPINVATTQLTESTVRVTWQANPCSATPGGYLVGYPGNWFNYLPGTTTSFDMTDLYPGYPYTLTIHPYVTSPGGYQHYGVETRRPVTTVRAPAPDPVIPGRDPASEDPDEADPPADTTRPTRVAGLRRLKATRTSITMTWAHARDDRKVTRYVVSRIVRGKLVTVGTVTNGTPRITIAKLKRNTPNVFVVVAYDAAGNAGAASARVTMRTAR